MCRGTYWQSSTEAFSSAAQRPQEINSCEQVVLVGITSPKPLVLLPSRPDVKGEQPLIPADAFPTCASTRRVSRLFFEVRFAATPSLTAQFPT